MSEEETAKLILFRKTLEFYADVENWTIPDNGERHQDYTRIWDDAEKAPFIDNHVGGRRARRALGENWEQESKDELSDFARQQMIKALEWAKRHHCMGWNDYTEEENAHQKRIMAAIQRLREGGELEDV